MLIKALIETVKRCDTLSHADSENHKPVSVLKYCAEINNLWFSLILWNIVNIILCYMSWNTNIRPESTRMSFFLWKQYKKSFSFFCKYLKTKRTHMNVWFEQQAALTENHISDKICMKTTLLLTIIHYLTHSILS